MANEIISIRQPSIETSTTGVLQAQAGIRMLRSYVAEHIPIDVETGPNSGMAGPDIVFQCDALLSLLDDVYEDLQSIAVKRHAA